MGTLAKRASSASDRRKADQGRGNGAGDHEPEETDGGGIGPRRPERGKDESRDIPPEVQEHGPEGGQMDGGMEQHAGFLETRKPGLQKHQVAGAADREKLRQPLQYSEGRESQGRGHGSSSTGNERARWPVERDRTLLRNGQ